jgi:CHAT domain-containing protein
MNQMIYIKVRFVLVLFLSNWIGFSFAQVEGKNSLALAQEGNTTAWIAHYQAAFSQLESYSKDSIEPQQHRLGQQFFSEYLNANVQLETEELSRFFSETKLREMISGVILEYVLTKLNAGVPIEKNQKFFELLDFLITAAKAENNHNLLARYYLAEAFAGYLPKNIRPIDIGNSFKLAAEQLPMTENFPKRDANQIYIQYANHLFGIDGDLEEALTQFKNSLQLWTAADPSRVKIPAYMGIIRVLTAKGDLELAADYAEQVLKLTKNESVGGQLQLYNLLAKRALYAGDWRTAEELLQKVKTAFEDIRALGSHRQIRHDLYSYEILNLQLKYQKSETIVLKDEMILEAKNMGHAQFEYWEALFDHARLANDSAFVKKLEAYFNAVTPKDNPFLQLPKFNLVLRAQGAYHAKQGDYQKAIAYFEQAIQQLSTKSSKDEMLLQFVREDQQALKILKSKLDAEVNLYQKRPDRIQLDDIYNTAMQAVALLDRMRQKLSTKGARTLLLQDAPLVFEQAIWVAHKMYQQHQDESFLEEAFSFAEKNKAVLLLDALKENQAKKFANIPEQLMQQEQSLLQDISYYRAELSRAEEKGDSVRIPKLRQYLFDKRKALDELKTELEQKYPRYFQLKYESAPITLEELQALLKKEEISVLEYAFTPNYLFIFRIDNKQIELIEYPLEKEFLANLNQFYLQLTNVEQVKKAESKNLKLYQSTAHELYQKLIEVAYGEDLPARLLLIADGLLAYLPFEVLVRTEKSDLKHYAELDYCLFYSRMTYAYSATLWSESMQQKIPRNSKGVLAIAPEYNVEKSGKNRGDLDWAKIRKLLPHLEGATKEVDYLAANFKGKFLKAEAANCQTFLGEAQNYALIHLAMHGVVDKFNPSYSALFFTAVSDSLEKDILFAYEIPSLEIQAELVVLSACQTGYGKYQSGEGVMSLGRSFMYAGASSLLLTLWEVNDESGAYLMKYFYQGLAEGLPKDDALQKAKITYLKTSDHLAGHPYFWSNYILLGNNKAVSSLVPKSVFGNSIWVLMGTIFLFLAIVLFWRLRKTSKN